MKWIVCILLALLVGCERESDYEWPTFGNEGTACTCVDYPSDTIDIIYLARVPDETILRQFLDRDVSPFRRKVYHIRWWTPEGQDATYASTIEHLYNGSGIRFQEWNNGVQQSDEPWTVLRDVQLEVTECPILEKTVPDWWAEKLNAYRNNPPCQGCGHNGDGEYVNAKYYRWNGERWVRK